jgi:hypothetical protein
MRTSAAAASATATEAPRAEAKTDCRHRVTVILNSPTRGAVGSSPNKEILPIVGLGMPGSMFVKVLNITVPLPRRWAESTITTSRIEIETSTNHTHVSRFVVT